MESVATCNSLTVGVKSTLWAPARRRPAPASWVCPTAVRSNATQATVIDERFMSSPSRAVSETPGDIERCESGRDSSTPRRGGGNRLRRAGPLDDLDKGVCRNRVEPLHGSARPSNLYGIDLRARAKSKVEARVTARQI